MSKSVWAGGTKRDRGSIHCREIQVGLARSNPAQLMSAPAHQNEGEEETEKLQTCGRLVDMMCTGLLIQKPLSLVFFCAAFNEDFKKPQIILHWISGIQQYFFY